MVDTAGDAKGETGEQDAGTHAIIPLRRYVESASATTSPDNADSGNFAYVLTGCVLAGLVAISLAVANVASSVIAAGIASEASSSTGTDMSDELDELLDQLMGGTEELGWDDGTGRATTGTSDELSLGEALDLDLALYGSTVDDQVSATAYAGVPDDVRTYVRSLLAADGDAASALAQSLNAAAREDDPASSMQAVADAARSGRAAIEDMKAPDTADADLDQLLQEANDAMLERWDAIAAEVAVLDEGSAADETISLQDLRDADDEVLEKTSEAAGDLTEALETAAGN